MELSQALKQADESLCAVERGLQKRRLSGWTLSGGKRLFDCLCVLAALPLLMPLLAVIALFVWLTSAGPVLFLQKRVGRNGRIFTIAKFRTMVEPAGGVREAFTTVSNPRFTAIGMFLRRWKLDELPQLLNVLAGDMSLVGPRPKLPELTIAVFPCRPGITGAATLAFAREEAVLDRVPVDRLQECYHSVVLPAKQRMDAEYMERATFFSDVRVLVCTLLRRWDGTTMAALLHAALQNSEARIPLGGGGQVTAAAESIAY